MNSFVYPAQPVARTASRSM